MLLHPSNDWPKVWHNVHTAPITEEMKSVWFTVIHDIIPTNERLAKIHLTDTTLCKYCGKPDTLQHRINECSEGTDIWRWTRTRLAIILRTNPIYISPEWAIRPHFHFRPPSGREQFYGCSHIWYTSEYNNNDDYADYMGRARWKAYRRPQHREKVGRYLDIL